MRKLRWTTRSGHESRMRRHVLPSLGSLQLGKVAPDHVRAVLVNVSQSGMSRTTVAMVRDTLATILERAVRDRVLPHNPVHAVDSLQRGKPRSCALSAAHSRAIGHGAMNDGVQQPSDTGVGVTHPSDEEQVRRLYADLIEGWNRRDASRMALLFADDGNVIGFDGSQMDGPREIEALLGGIFVDHPTAHYLTIVREVRLPAPDTAILRAVVGMIPPGHDDIDPAVNAIQTLVAARREGRWRVELFQTTPAAFHGRPDESARLTEELRRAREPTAPPRRNPPPRTRRSRSPAPRP